MKKLLIIAILAFVATATTVPVTDDSIKVGSTVHWTSGNTYLLNGIVYVDSGATLTIDSGVTVQAKYYGEGVFPPAMLIICKNARIYANGTKTKPVVFTTEKDSSFTIADYKKSGYWGGIAILGKASNNYNSGTRSIYYIEDPRATHGGGTNPDDNDTSGILRYVSIRYAGAAIDQDVFISGLTLGSVGRGTKIEFVEVYNSTSSAFQWYGGTVGCKYLIAHSRSILFNYTGGFNGRGQYWVSINNNNLSSASLSQDLNIFGSTDQGTNINSPNLISSPVICNFTHFGTESLTYPMLFTSFGGGCFYNSIIYNAYQGMKVEKTASVYSSFNNIANKKLKVANSIWWQIGGGAVHRFNKWFHPEGEDHVVGTLGKTYVDTLRSWGDTIINPMFLKTPNSLIPGSKTLDLRPSDSLFRTQLGNTDTLGVHKLSSTWYSGPFNNLAFNIDSIFFDKVQYRGAFDPIQDTCWWLGWTALDKYEYLLRHYQKVVDVSINRPVPPEERNIVKNVLASSDNMGLSRNLSISVNDRVLRCNYTTGTQSRVTIDIFNLRGSRLGTYSNSIAEAGTHTISIPVKNFATGQYILRFKSNARVISKMFNIIK